MWAQHGKGRVKKGEGPRVGHMAGWAGAVGKGWECSWSWFLEVKDCPLYFIFIAKPLKISTRK